MTVAEVRAELLYMTALREDAARTALLAANGKQAVRLVSPDAGDIIIHPSTREPGRWQLSWFFRDGLAGGHGTFDSQQEAIRSATGEWVKGNPAYGDATYRVSQ